MKMRSWSLSSGDILVPSTFTGWYRKMMMTMAKPTAKSTSRAQLRSSRRRAEEDETSVGGAGLSWAGSSIVDLKKATYITARGVAPTANCSAPGAGNRHSRASHHRMQAMATRVSVIVPALDEEDAIGQTLSELAAAGGLRRGSLQVIV